MTTPTTLDPEPKTTTTHRPRCDRPGWDVAPSRSVHGIAVARCLGCGAVEIRTNPDERTQP